jgi:phage virion morphogenesis protein
MSDGLDQLEDLAGGLLRAVAPAERRKLLRTVARDVQKSQRTRIAAQLQPDGSKFAPRKAKQPKGRLRRKGAIKRAAMFRKLRLVKYLQAGATDSEAWIGFSGSAARIARVHQDGGTDAPAKGQAKVRYAKREILGPTDADRQILLDAALAHLAP